MAAAAFFTALLAIVGGPLAAQAAVMRGVKQAYNLKVCLVLARV